MTQRVKVSFPMGDGTVERMYAKPVGEGRYILDNSPFYVFDISYCDEFSADHVEEELVFSRVISRSGHSTYRIKLPEGEDHSYFLKYWVDLAAEGCTYEGSSVSSRLLYTIDLPPGVDVMNVYKIMDQYEQQGIWEFEEGHYCANAVRSH